MTLKAPLPPLQQENTQYGTDATMLEDIKVLSRQNLNGS